MTQLVRKVVESQSECQIWFDYSSDHAMTIVFVTFGCTDDTHGHHAIRDKKPLIGFCCGKSFAILLPLLFAVLRPPWAECDAVWYEITWISSVCFFRTAAHDDQNERMEWQKLSLIIVRCLLMVSIRGLFRIHFLCKFMIDKSKNSFMLIKTKRNTQKCRKFNW